MSEDKSPSVFCVNIHDNTKNNGYSYYDGGNLVSEGITRGDTLEEVRKQFPWDHPAYHLVYKFERDHLVKEIKTDETQIHAATIINGNTFYIIVVLKDSADNVRAIMRHRSARNTQGEFVQMTEDELAKKKFRTVVSSTGEWSTRKNRRLMRVRFFESKTTSERHVICSGDTVSESVEEQLRKELAEVKARADKQQKMLEFIFNKFGYDISDFV